MLKTFFLGITFVFISTNVFSQFYINSVIHHSNCLSACDGSIAVAGNGGIGPYSYTWAPSGVNTSTINNLCPGQYTVYVTDALNNTLYNVINVLEQPSNFIPMYTWNASCQSSCTGSITPIGTNGAGGGGPYTYYLNNMIVNPFATIGNLCVGTYTLKVTDGVNCSSNQLIYMQPLSTSEYSTFVSYTNTACGNCNGAASITSYASNSYTWYPGGTVSSSLSNVCAGNYTIDVIENTGCTFTKTVSVLNVGSTSPIPNLSVTANVNNETCLQSGDGVITLFLSGSNPGPFNYLWSNGATSQNVLNVNSGNYQVAITDGNSNCLLVQNVVGVTGINCGSISGNVYFDNNSDCINNGGDVNCNFATVVINPGNRIGLTNSAGSYTVNNLTFATYSVSSQNYYSVYIPTCTQTMASTVSAGTQNVINNNFSLGFSSATNPDMKVSAYSIGIVPGFISKVIYTLSNLNNVFTNGLFKVTLSSPLISSVSSCVPSTYLISGDTIIWNYANVTYSGGQMNFTVSINVPVSLSLGSTFTSCIYAQPSILDLNYLNNDFCYNRIVTSSFDPNAKTVSPIGIGANGEIATSITDLTYLIQFQNTGNGPAVNIVIKDTLSSNVDVNSFQMIKSSHNYILDILPGNILRWKFNNIMLIDSNSNEPASHGYIQYRIKRNNINTPGTQIKNTAYIYFDFNDPIITNTAINTIEIPSGINALNNNTSWSIYPNPNKGNLYIVNQSGNKEASQVQIINTMGQIIIDENIQNNYKNIDLSKLNNGIYFIKIISSTTTEISRIVLSK